MKGAPAKSDSASIVALPSAEPRKILAVAFANHGRTGPSKAATRELQYGAPEGTLNNRYGILTEDPAGIGIWVDGKVRIPWANILWAEYE